MHHTKKVAIAGVALLGASLGLAGSVGSAGAAPGATAPTASSAAPSADDDGHAHNLTMPWQERYSDVRQAALEQRLRNGGSGAAEKLSKGVYGQVEQTGATKVFAVIAEYGDERHSEFPDGETDAQRYDGPRHNEIPRPNRNRDNSTLWKKNYNRAHFQDMYFNRMDKFYRNQSMGQFSIDGTVTEWVKVPFNQARYGRDVCGDVVCNNTWDLLRDAMAIWTQGQLDAGQTMAEINEYLSTFDLEDRYDFDEDGDFYEPDGYIDHFQIVHAGGDQADGDPVYGEDAIWSHRWYAQVEPFGSDGPANGGPFGGFAIGQGGVEDPEGAAVEIPDNPTDVWVGDYTIQPENGGLSVFAHEFAHDLGLPDLYDTDGVASNSVELWSLMAQSRGTYKKDYGIGDRPTPFGAWDKFQLGWLDYETARSGRTSTHKIRPNSINEGSAANGLVVILPDKEVEQDLGAPCGSCGERYYYSGAGNDLDNTMSTEIEAGGELSAQVRYQIEEGWDYAFLEATTDGETWESLPTSLSYEGPDESGFNPDGTGLSGSTEGEWAELTATVPDDAVGLRWRYLTDGAAVEPGLQVDAITLDGTEIGTAEEGDDAWELDGFTTTTGSEVQKFLNAYFVDNRQLKGRDKAIGNVYNFGFTGKKSEFVEFYGYEPGALISYWDTSYSDNNVGAHPGGGQILPVDARPNFSHYPDGSLVRTRVMTRDSTFSDKRSKTITLHYGGTPFTVRGQSAQPKFDDTLDYWFDSDEHGSGEHVGAYQPGWFSVDVPKTGTTIEVLNTSKKGVIRVRVGTS